MQRRLKKSVVYGLYGLAFCLMLGGLFFIESTSGEENFASVDEEYQYVSKNILDKVKEDIPVVASETEKTTINRPYTNESVKIVKDYYNTSDDEATQKNSLIYYEDTYIQSSGVSYGLEEQFDVVAILDGSVKEVKEDNILGNIITIEHDNGIISTYQSVSDITVKKGDTVKQGDVIAKSSTSNISADLGNHLYFELVINGANVDPEDYFDVSIDEV